MTRRLRVVPYVCRALVYRYLLIAVANPGIAASFTPLGELPGGATFSLALGLSPDGGVAVGISASSTASSEAFRWTSGGGMQGLGLRPGDMSSQATKVSTNGAVIVGAGLSGIGAPVTEAWRWTQAAGFQGLGLLPGGSGSLGPVVSADGSVIAGTGTFNAAPSEGFRWTEASGIQPIGVQGQVFGISGNGAVIVGGTGGSAGEAFYWTEASGKVGLGDLPGGGFSSVAAAASLDGSVIVGGGSTDNGTEVFRWTNAGGMVGLGRLTSTDYLAEALAVSADGSVISGHAYRQEDIFSPVIEEAFRWTAAEGIRSVSQLLTDAGLGAAIAGWSLQSAIGISADGSTLAGYGLNPTGQTEAWVAVIPIPEPSSWTMFLAMIGLAAAQKPIPRTFVVT